MIEKMFKWVPGHEERVRRRQEYGYTGLSKVIDIITFGGMVRAREEGQKDGEKAGRRLQLAIHNTLYDLFHH